MIGFTRFLIESTSICMARTVFGEEAVAEHAQSALSTSQMSRLASRHPNQTAGIIEGWQD